jgi:hypothetical protein
VGGYLAFYRQHLDAATTDATWDRVLHWPRGMIGRVAETGGRLTKLLAREAILTTARLKEPRTLSARAWRCRSSERT